MDIKSLLDLFRKTFCRGCLIAGPIFVALAFAFGIHTYAFLKSSLSTSAVVVSETPVHSSDDNSLSFAPVFSFTAANGQIYTITSNISSKPPEFSLGQRVNVLYDKSNPTLAKLSSFRQLWTTATVFAILGIITSATGLILLKMERRRTLQRA